MENDQSFTCIRCRSIDEFSSYLTERNSSSKADFRRLLLSYANRIPCEKPECLETRDSLLELLKSKVVISKKNSNSNNTCKIQEECISQLKKLIQKMQRTLLEISYEVNERFPFNKAKPYFVDLEKFFKESDDDIDKKPYAPSFNCSRDQVTDVIAKPEDPAPQLTKLVSKHEIEPIPEKSTEDPEQLRLVHPPSPGPIVKEFASSTVPLKTRYSFFEKRRCSISKEVMGSSDQPNIDPQPHNLRRRNSKPSNQRNGNPLPHDIRKRNNPKPLNQRNGDHSRPLDKQTVNHQSYDLLNKSSRPFNQRNENSRPLDQGSGCLSFSDQQIEASWLFDHPIRIFRSDQRNKKRRIRGSKFSKTSFRVFSDSSSNQNHRLLFSCPQPCLKSTKFLQAANPSSSNVQQKADSSINQNVFNGKDGDITRSSACSSNLSCSSSALSSKFLMLRLSKSTTSSSINPSEAPAISVSQSQPSKYAVAAGWCS